MNKSFISLGILILFSCGSKEEAPPPSTVEVTEFVVEPKTVPAVFDSIGFAESIHPVEIRARVEGYLDNIAYEEGQIVTREHSLPSTQRAAASASRGSDFPAWACADRGCGRTSPTGMPRAASAAARVAP